MKRLLYFLLLLSSMAFGQGGIASLQQALKVVNGVTSPIPNATITVCAANAAGIPCAPALVGVVFKDALLTQTLPNPFTSDANGNYQFAAKTGQYTVTVTASGFSGQTYQVQIVGGSNLTGTQVVDGINNLTVQAAINALPANGGQVLIPCGTFVGPTTIPSNTSLISTCPAWISNKYSGQWGLGPGSSLNIQAISGTTLTYTGVLALTQVQNITISNIVLDFQSFDAGVNIASSSFIHMDHVVIDRCGGTTSATPCLLMGNVGSGGQNNNALNTFDHLAINAAPNPFAGTVTGISIIGINRNGPAVTQNKFTDVVIGGAIAVGIDFVQNCDTNWFYGVVINSTTAGAIGLRFNAANPTIDEDVNAIQILGYSCSSNCASPFLQFGLSSGNYIVTQGNPVAPTILGGAPKYTVIWTGSTVGGGSPTTFSNTPFVFNDGTQSNTVFQAGGTAPTLTGTGACATTSTQVGGMSAGNFTCTGTTGASTVTLTFPTAAAHWYACSASDTTHTLAGSQSGTASTTACTMTFTSVTASDIITFGAIAF